MNQRAPIDYVLAQPLSETLTIQGRAESVLAAHIMAANGLSDVLGGDSAAAWSLKAMDHTHAGFEPAVDFVAQFVRNPEFEEES